MANHVSTAPAQATPGPSERYLSRDISWLKFNERVLDQVVRAENGLSEQLKFLMISATNLDEFFMIRVGSLYNYIDYPRTWKNHWDWQAACFRRMLLLKAKKTFNKQHEYFLQKLIPACKADHCVLLQDLSILGQQEQQQLANYFNETLFSMLTPMVFDSHHDTPIIMNRVLVLGVVTYDPTDQQANKKFSFVQLPQNLPRFYPLNRSDGIGFVPIEEIVRFHLPTLFKNISILSSTLFRVIRNGDFSLEEGEGMENNFIEQLKRKLKKRNQGRVVRLEIEVHYDQTLLSFLKQQWDIDEDNVFQVPAQSLVDLTRLQQLAQHHSSRDYTTVPLLTYPLLHADDLFEVLKQQDLLLHHPYNSIDLVI
ncbi:MAG: polyphosphate kinase 1, partial [Bacteroidota bacterium]